MTSPKLKLYTVPANIVLAPNLRVIFIQNQLKVYSRILFLSLGSSSNYPNETVMCHVAVALFIQRSSRGRSKSSQCLTIYSVHIWNIHICTYTVTWHRGEKGVKTWKNLFFLRLQWNILCFQNSSFLLLGAWPLME